MQLQMLDATLIIVALHNCDVQPRNHGLRPVSAVRDEQWLAFKPTGVAA
jgi:hypothetical protein